MKTPQDWLRSKSKCLGSQIKGSEYFELSCSIHVVLLLQGQQQPAFPKHKQKVDSFFSVWIPATFTTDWTRDWKLLWIVLKPLQGKSCVLVVLEQRVWLYQHSSFNNDCLSSLLNLLLYWQQRAPRKEGHQKSSQTCACKVLGEREHKGPVICVLPWFVFIIFQFMFLSLHY